MNSLVLRGRRRHLLAVMAALALLTAFLAVPAGAEDGVYPPDPSAEPRAEVCTAAGVTVDGVANGSFETGDFTGWCTDDLAGFFDPIKVVGAGYTPWDGFFLTAPTDGAFVMQHGFDGDGPGSIDLYQEVTISPGAAVADLSFDWRAAWDLDTFSFPGASDRMLDVVIEPVGGGAALATYPVFTAPVPTLVTDTGGAAESISLLAFSGETIRVVLRSTIPDSFTGPASLQIDDVVLTVEQGYCSGVAATIGGTEGDDVIVGTPLRDVIVGLEGNDLIEGLGGADLICGGPGRDEIFGGDGADVLNGGSHIDLLDGGAGDDELFGNKGDDLLFGDIGNDVLNGGQGRDFLDGWVGNDVLKGDGQADLLFGYDGQDTLEGGDGPDELMGESGRDVLDGGAGDDLLDGGSGFDELDGGTGTNTCVPGNGNFTNC